jgi:hypothetical protein
MMLNRCIYCDGVREEEPCALCGGDGVLELEFKDVCELVDEINMTLAPILRSNPDIDDALADAAPQLADLLLKWR